LRDLEIAISDSFTIRHYLLFVSSQTYADIAADAESVVFVQTCMVELMTQVRLTAAWCIVLFPCQNDYSSTFQPD